MSSGGSDMTCGSKAPLRPLWVAVLATAAAIAQAIAVRIMCFGSLICWYLVPFGRDHVSVFFRWWNEYADRKNDEEHEYVANSLLYDRNHLPRTVAAPDCVVRTPSTPLQHQSNQSKDAKPQ